MYSAEYTYRQSSVWWEQWIWRKMLYKNQRLYKLPGTQLNR
ncbi:hypothetical protein XNC1_1199 [Xenorhabdus nematophila ATCC 19061]|uniref:Uncharacterized protein n=1 Tax=Xenorhabdus nematophila (strain ATCC 19061 / DSM 3370 / CCUG 14189 / LMG 1036 / NCIMB 9965 / AN6) TaxID=406817 RepID=D3V9N2_XENNA|nr:hypothetical protein XNC1_1199 [Xenorhabdus nematophila ATCC 19061]